MLTDGRPSVTDSRPPGVTDRRVGAGTAGHGRPGLPTDPSGWPWSELVSHLREVDRVIHRRLADLQQSWERIVPPHDSAAPAINLARHVAELVAAGGKRFRPALAFLGHRAVGGAAGGDDAAQLATIGAALELLHTFALSQDDVMDRSAMRRGRPTLHAAVAADHRDHGGRGDPVRYGDSIAVLAGDLAHAEAQDLIAAAAPAVRRHWHAMVVELVHGQGLDLAGAAWRCTDPERALLVARLKSGAYTIQRPLELGALASGADGARLAALSEFGHELGLAFALRDDVLGVWGDPSRTGKPAGDDLVEGKPTLILALAARRLGDAALLARVGSPDLTAADVASLQQVLLDCGIRDEIEARIRRHLAQALAALSRLPHDTPDRGRQTPSSLDPIAALASIARDVAERDR